MNIKLKQAAKSFVDKYYRSEEYPIKIKDIISDAEDIFKAGAKWARASVWHDMKQEEPQVFGKYENQYYPQIPCLVQGQLSTGYGYGVRYWNITEKVWDDEECDDCECEKDAIEMWAYLDDILPEE